MLVFSRKRGESVAVGECDEGEHMLKVTVLEIQHSQVKLGFEAPNDVPVHRWEVWQRINGNGGNPSQVRPAPKKSVDRWAGDGESATRAKRNRRPPAPSG
jgi:carbon storage regulator